MLPRQTYKTCLTIFMLFALGIVCAQAGVLTVKSNNANYGTVKIGSGTASGTVTSNVSSGQKVTISATAKTGHKFVKWNDNNTTASRQITIANNNNIAYTATFEPLQYTLTVTSSNTNYGTVTGGGTYNYGTSVTLKATPKTGYHFVKWNDNNTNASRSVKVTAAATYTATFAINTYTLTIKTATGNTTQGTVRFAGGTAGASASQSFNYNNGVNIIATPTGCYRFKQWNDGNTNANRTVTVTAAKTYIATFEATTHSGTCGTNVNWTFNECTGALSITGTGAMNNYGSGTSPWYSYRASITSVTIANTVTSIGSYAFYHCDNLASISIGTGVTSIGTEAFWYCGKLPSVTIPNGVTNIGSWAFESCSSLKDIYVSWTTAAAIPTWTSMTTGTASSITLHVPCGSGDIYRAANGWKNYTITGSGTAQYTLTVNANNSALGTVKIDNGTAGATASLKTHCEDTHTITATLNNDVGCYYFKRWSDGNYENPRKIGISANKNITAEFVEGLGSGTCGSNLTWVLECDSTLRISGTGMMSDFGYSNQPWQSVSTLIKRVVIEEGVTSIGNYAFYAMKKIETVTNPSTLKTIGTMAFHSCYGLESINFPDGLTSIGGNTTGHGPFYGCHSLKSIYIPASVTMINKDAFLRCYSATSIVVDPANTVYDSRDNCNAIIETATNKLLYGCQTTVIPDGVLTVSQFAFEYQHNLKSIRISNTVTSFGTTVFKECENLKDIYVEWTTTPPANNLTTWAEHPNLDATITIHVPCGKKNLYTSSSVWNRYQIVDDHLKGGMCGAQGSNQTWMLSCDGQLDIKGIGEMADYTAGGAPWYNHRNSIHTITFADGITSIGENAFADFTNLTDIYAPWTENIPVLPASNNPQPSVKLHIPCSVISAYQAAGWGNYTVETEYTASGTCGADGDNLTWTLCEGVLTISGTGAMANYPALNMPWKYFITSITSVIISDGVTTIGTSAFNGCSNLTTLTVPPSLTSIGQNAFSGCWAMESLYISDLTAWCNISFGTYDSSPFCRNGYLIYVGGGDLYVNGTKVTTLTIPDGVTEIKNHAFYGCACITDIQFNQVTSIGNEAFNGCHGLTEVTIPEGVTAIGNYGFAYCTHLQSISIPASASSLGTSMLAADNALTDIYVQWTENIPVWPENFTKKSPQSSITLHVPCGAMNLYQTANGWKDYTLEAESGPYTITVTAEEGGSVDGGGSFNCGASVTLTATPDNNYRFIQWSDGDTHNPRSVTVNGNATYTAQFGIAQYTITVNAETGGTATGSGTYNTDQVINLTATPDDCYMFKQWTDGDTHNPRMVSVNGEVTYTAQFEKLQFTVTASPDDETKGDVNIEKVE